LFLFKDDQVCKKAEKYVQWWGEKSYTKINPKYKLKNK
jgi:hypothetical protein